MNHSYLKLGVSAMPLALLFAASASIAAAQPSTPTPAAGSAQAAAVAVPTANETLVSRIALYPDDLIAIVLPATTFPLQVIEASRYLDNRAKDASLPVKDSWDASVKSLLNYPTVIKAMNDDLEWMQALGDAVTKDQTAMLAAVQSYRRKVYAAGNLKTDEKQRVVIEENIITIAPANPQVIYVPVYNPSTIMVYGSYSSWGYHSYGYPSYYYPYPPGAALTAGLIWGAAIGSAWNGGHYVAHYGGYNGGIRINTGDININTGNRPSGGAGRPGGGTTLPAASGTAWQPGAQPRASTARVGDPARAGAAVPVSGPVSGASARSSAGQYGPAASSASGARASAGTYGPRSPGASSYGGTGGTRDMASGSRYSGSSMSRGSYGGGYAGGSGAFSGYGSGASTGMASARGAKSRSYSGGGVRRR